ncbi:MAG TPA: DUF6600 domain-containing protein [Candidatus Polarisedimenticolia bacterium]|nr:DUF6600 domain-containing protein [Candidatus Polarisedimenticolia bacterium]
MFAKTGVRASGRFGRLLVAAGLLLPLAAALPPAAFAGEEDEEAGSIYARVRWLDSGLSVERPSEGEVLAASANLPIIPGDRVSTGGGRAEIELADSSVLWLGEGTRLEVRNLADYDTRYERTNLLVLRRGALRIDNRDSTDSESVFQIDTEAGSIYLLSGGSFRIEANGSGTIVSAYSGVAEFSGEGGSVLVRTGQRSSVAIGAVPDEPRRFNTGRSDDFDRFHDDRVAAYVSDGSEPPEYEEVPVEVRPYVRELSSYGTWTTIAPYGVVWRPVFAGGWSPYTHGTWGWYPTGWVWISYDPWGWAPYRYGRWDYAPSYGWFWVPGRIWSGAWVSFAVSTTYVGWCPLNYWNRPVFHDPWIAGVPAVSVARLDPRGWQFVPAGRFGARGVAVAASRIDHLPRGTEVVVTRSLPAPLNPRAVATRTDPARGFYDQVRRSRVALPAASSSSGEPVSFRVQEHRQSVPPGAPKRAAPPRGRASQPRLSPSGAIAVPHQSAAASPAPRARTARPDDGTRTEPPKSSRAPHDTQARQQPQGRVVGQMAAPPQASRTTAPRTTTPTRTTTAPPAPRNADPSRATRQNPSRTPQETPPPAPHDPAVGRLVGGARPAPATPPQNSTSPTATPRSATPASQAEPDPTASQNRGASRSDSAREKQHQGKRQGKGPEKPKEQDNRASGS